MSMVKAIDALKAENERLRNALEPFARMHRDGSDPAELACQRGTASDMTIIFSRDFTAAVSALATPPAQVSYAHAETPWIESASYPSYQQRYNAEGHIETRPPITPPGETAEKTHAEFVREEYEKLPAWKRGEIGVSTPSQVKASATYPSQPTEQKCLKCGATSLEQAENICLPEGDDCPGTLLWGQAPAAPAVTGEPTRPILDCVRCDNPIGDCDNSKDGIELCAGCRKEEDGSSVPAAPSPELWEAARDSRESLTELVGAIAINSRNVLGLPCFCDTPELHSESCVAARQAVSKAKYNSAALDRLMGEKP